MFLFAYSAQKEEEKEFDKIVKSWLARCVLNSLILHALIYSIMTPSPPHINLVLLI